MLKIKLIVNVEGTNVLQPIDDHVIVKVKKGEEETIDDIVLTSNAKEKPTEGKVVVVSNGLVTSEGKVLPMTVREDDRVIYDKYPGTSVKYDGEEYLIFHEKDILAIVK